jgi:hypothetical protein
MHFLVTRPQHRASFFTAWCAAAQGRNERLAFVMCGLDPRIHPSSQEDFEEDGLPGQARQ